MCEGSLRRKTSLQYGERTTAYLLWPYPSLVFGENLVPAPFALHEKARKMAGS